MPPKGAKGKAAKAAKPKVYDYSGLEKGMRVQADWDGSGIYSAAEVVVVSESKNRAKAPVKVTFPGYTKDSDVWVGGDCLRSKNLKIKKEPKPEGEKKPREPRKVWMFALTGGPCGGKGSCQKYLREKLEEKGYDIYTCPEGPTIFFNNGALNAFFPGEKPGPNFPGGSLIDNLPATKDKLQQFETAIIQMQLQMESGFQTMARSTGKKSIIFCDRGVFDIACYLPDMAEGDAWKSLLKKNNQVPIKLLSRYAGVLHLQTAAIGAEKFYKSGDTTDDAGNKVFRRETPEEAKTLDANVLKCWKQHKNLIEITNEGLSGADAKWEKCLHAVLKAVEPPAEPAA
jgi:hypothetical protein